MRAILMAAGMGTRIANMTDAPKSLLDIGNGPLIRHTVQMLLHHGIDVGVCIGYKGYLIQEALQDLSVTFYDNPFYKVTNSIASLWFARDELEKDEDVILANADVFWQEDILSLLLEENADVCLLEDTLRKDSGDYFFRCENGVLKAYGKDLAMHERTSEYVGVARVNRSMLYDFYQRMVKLVHDGDYQLWWENILYSMIDERDIYVFDIAGHYWSEIDEIKDYENILAYVEKYGIQ